MTIEIDDREINETLDHFIRAAVDLTLAMRKASRVMLEAAEDVFPTPVGMNRRLPSLLNAAGEPKPVGYSKRTGNPLVRWLVRGDDQIWHLIFDVRKKRRMLVLCTVYIIKKANRP